MTTSLAPAVTPSWYVWTRPAPELDATNTFTGTWLDGTMTRSPAADAIRTSIVVAFNEALDCDSVSADDFEVDGSAPNGVTCKGSNVYLDVDELDPNDKPEMEVGRRSPSPTRPVTSSGTKMR